MLNNEALAAMAANLGASNLFERVFSRMTAAECVAALVSEGLVSGTPTVPASRSAEAALSHLDFNGGAGSWISTSPYRYAGGVFLLNKRAHQIKGMLDSLFAADRAAFLSASVGASDARALALVGDPPPSAGVAAQGATRILMWQASTKAAVEAAYPAIDARQNLIWPIQSFFAQGGIAADAYNINATRDLLTARPEGRRWIVMSDFNPLWAIPVTSGAAAGRYAMYSREFDHATRRGLSLDLWYSTITAAGSKWRTYWSELRAAGEALYGVGQGGRLVDGVMIDVERLRRFYPLKNGDGLAGGENWGHIFTDNPAEWADWRDNRLGPPLAQAVWDGYSGWDYNIDERAFVVDACLVADYATKLSAVAAIAKTEFGKPIEFVEYQTRLTAPGCRSIGLAPGAFMAPYGTASDLDGANAVSLYGGYNSSRWHWPSLALQSITTIWAATYDTATNIATVNAHPFATGSLVKVTAGTTVAPLLAGETYYYVRVLSASTLTFHPTLADAQNNTGAVDLQAGGVGTQIVIHALKDEWNAFLQNIMQLRAAAAAGRGTILHTWLATEGFHTAAYHIGLGGLYPELVLHATLLADHTDLYQPGESPADHQLFVDLVAERDAVVGFGRAYDPPPALNWDEAFIATTVWAGGRQIWRVTPSVNGGACVVSVSGADLVFTNALGALTIPRGKSLALSQSAIAPLGYWVEQASAQQALFCQWGGAYAGAEAGQAA